LIDNGKGDVQITYMQEIDIITKGRNMHNKGRCRGRGDNFLFIFNSSQKCTFGPYILGLFSFWSL